MLAKNVKSFEIWEIDQKLKPQLEKSFPNSEIKICDSIEILNKSQKIRKFDLVLIDNPMNVFGIKKNSFEYCEHFDVIKNIPKLMDKEVIVIFLVNKKPFFFKISRQNTNSNIFIHYVPFPPDFFNHSRIFVFFSRFTEKQSRFLLEKLDFFVW